MYSRLCSIEDEECGHSDTSRCGKKHAISAAAVNPKTGTTINHDPKHCGKHGRRLGRTDRLDGRAKPRQWSDRGHANACRRNAKHLAAIHAGSAGLHPAPLAGPTPCADRCLRRRERPGRRILPDGVSQWIQRDHRVARAARRLADGSAAHGPGQWSKRSPSWARSTTARRG
jgi:hypothetical protein